MKNEWETWVCLQGLSFMLKVVIEECFQMIDVWNVVIKLLLWKNPFVLEKCIWGQKYFCLSQQPNFSGLYVALWNDSHVAGLVPCAPAWAGQGKPAQIELCLLVLWKRLPTSPRGVLIIPGAQGMNFEHFSALALLSVVKHILLISFASAASVLFCLLTFLSKK